MSLPALSDSSIQTSPSSEIKRKSCRPSASTPWLPAKSAVSRSLAVSSRLPCSPSYSSKFQVPSQGNNTLRGGRERCIRPRVHIVPCDEVVRPFHRDVVDGFGGEEVNRGDALPRGRGVVCARGVFAERAFASCRHCDGHTNLQVSYLNPFPVRLVDFNRPKRSIMFPMRRIILNKHIVADPEICHGKPTFSGTRIMVWQVFELLAAGEKSSDILKTFPSLRLEHIKAALQYASSITRDHYVIVNTERGAIPA